MATVHTDENRRRSAVNDQIRLCTFHSSRGLEASRVVLFGLEQIERLSERIGFDFRKLSFIVLSRSTFDCLVVRRDHDRRVIPFLEKCLKEVLTENQ